VEAAALIKLRVLPRYRVGVGPSRRLDGRSLRTLTLEEARGPGVPRCARRYQALLRANAGLVRLMAPVELVTRRSAHNVLLFGAARPNRTPLMTGTLLRKPVLIRTAFSHVDRAAVQTSRGPFHMWRAANATSRRFGRQHPHRFL
jgi:hypothetical protein